MEFENQLKKETIEGNLRALLDEAGYRAVGYSVQKTAHRAAPMTYNGYWYV